MKPGFPLAQGPVLLFALALSCGGGGAGGFDPATSAYGARTPTTRTTSALSFSQDAIVDGPSTSRTSGIVGQKLIDGRSYDREANTNVSDSNQGDEFWIKRNGDGTIDFAGFDSHSGLAAQVFPQGSVVFTSPATLAEQPPIGQPQSVALVGTFTSADGAQSVPVAGAGVYTLAAKDAVAATDAGNLWGCDHFTGSISTTSTLAPQALQGVAVAGDVWIHPSFGVVAVSAPSLGIQTKMSGSIDCGTVDSSGHRTIRKLGIVDSAHGKFELGFATCMDAPDADKSGHAQMLLELRWQDEALAKTNIQPTNTYQLGTAAGEFRPKLASSDTSVFHPEENGKGYRYWREFASKAVAGTGGAFYGITVAPLANIPVRVTARIYYKAHPSSEPAEDASVGDPDARDAPPIDDAVGHDLPVAPDGAGDARDAILASDARPLRDASPIDVASPPDLGSVGDGRSPREGGNDGLAARDAPPADSQAARDAASGNGANAKD